MSSDNSAVLSELTSSNVLVKEFGNFISIWRGYKSYWDFYDQIKVYQKPVIKSLRLSNSVGG